MRTVLRGKLTLLFMTFTLVLAFPAMALADIVTNNVDNTVDANVEVLNLDVNQTKTVTFRIIEESKDDDTVKNGCNIQGQDKLVLNVASSDPTKATLNKSTIEFAGCQSQPTVNVTGIAAGPSDIVLTYNSGGGGAAGWKLAPAKFSVNVAAPQPQNRAPVVANDAQDVNGDEGQTLANNGSFSEADADSLAITKGSASNVAPTATLNAPNATNEGNNINLSLTNPTDPNNADTAAGFEYAFNCGNGYSAFGNSASASCSTNDDGTRSVGAKIKDKDGSVTRYTANVTVNNVAPVLSALDLTGNTGIACLGNNTVTLGFSFTDAGSADTHTGTIDWGDGSQAESFTISPVANRTHSYGPGTYTINVTVTDDDGASDGKTGAVNRSKWTLGGNLLAPVNLNGSSVFKYGSTIPMKIKVTDSANNPVPGLSPSIKFQKMSGSTPTADINETVSTSGADTNNVMRYDSTSGPYIYNLASKSLPDPEATYRAVIDETSTAQGTMTSQNFGLKR